jgi:hypothetical protein
VRKLWRFPKGKHKTQNGTPRILQSRKFVSDISFKVVPLSWLSSDLWSPCAQLGTLHVRKAFVYLGTKMQDPLSCRCVRSRLKMIGQAKKWLNNSPFRCLSHEIIAFDNTLLKVCLLPIVSHKKKLKITQNLRFLDQ